jgi:hypothetical protein
MDFPEIVDIALPGEGCKRSWPPLIEPDAVVKTTHGESEGGRIPWVGVVSAQ